MIKHCGSNLHSLITNDVGHCFMYLAIGISSLEKSIPLPLFFIELSFCDWVERGLSTFWTLDPYEITDLQVFFPIMLLFFLDGVLWCIIAFNFGQV